MIKELKIVKIDEIELYLHLLFNDYPEIQYLKFIEISDLIEKTYNVKCSEQDVKLLFDHFEPDALRSITFHKHTLQKI